jgi:hypothetical protein
LVMSANYQNKGSIYVFGRDQSLRPNLYIHLSRVESDLIEFVKNGEDEG